MKARAYPVPNADLMQVATLIVADLARAGFDVRIVNGTPAEPGLVVEIRRPHSLVQKSTGMGAMMKARLVPDPTGFRVHVGAGTLGDKAAGAVEWLLAAPAIMTEGYAAFQQAQVDERVFRVVEHWVTTVAGVPIQRGPAPVPAAGPCPACRQAMPYGARFCPRCGHDTESKAPLAACPACRGPIALDAVFCPGCGQKVAKDAAAACSSCEAPLGAGAIFCPSCGTRQMTVEDKP